MDFSEFCVEKCYFWCHFSTTLDIRFDIVLLTLHTCKITVSMAVMLVTVLLNTICKRAFRIVFPFVVAFVANKV